MKQIFFLSILLLLLITTISNAQTGFVSGEIRPRFEVQYGYKTPPDTINEPQVLISQRTRLNAGFNSEKVNAYISLQDARLWGDQIIATDVPSTGVQQAWGQYYFNKHISFKAGRQEFIYDNKRLLTDGLWIQQGRAFDAMLLKLALNGGWKVDAAVSFNQAVNNFYNTYYNLANPKTLDFLWVNKSKVDSNYKYSLSAIALGDGWQTPDTNGVNMRWTYGINASYDHQQWGLNLEAYGQSGKTREYNQSGFIIPDSFQTVKAYFFSVNPWISPIKNFQVGVGIDYLSGSDALDSTETDVTRMFNPQFGATHKFYGKIDIFFNLPADTRNGGLVDAYLNAKYDYKGWGMNLEYHYFALQNQVEDVENPGTALAKPLGSEVDLILIKDITKMVNLNTGFCMFFPTRSMEFVKSATISQLGSPTKTGYWFYAMLTFKPVFLNK
ncbi:MAG: alginate export family protein [Chitinophagales bacterium]|nr:alginate export family protein [Chitinophagales bacterium]